MKLKALRKNHRTVIFLIAILLLSFFAECLFSNFPYISTWGKRKKAGESSPAFAYSEGEFFVYPTTSPYEITLDVDSYVHSLSFTVCGIASVEYAPSSVTLKGKTADGEELTLSSRSLLFDRYSPSRVEILLGAKEKLSSLTLAFSPQNAFSVSDIKINEDYKFGFSLLRFSTILIVAVSAFLFSRLKLNRVYYFELAAEKRRAVAIVLCVISIILSLLAGALLAEKGESVKYPLEDKVNSYNNAYIQQYDAWRKGQTNIDFYPSDDFLALEDPYDFESRGGTYYLWDRAYYEGKFYSYFGITPIITVYAPAELITSSLPADHTVMTVFGTICTLFFTLTVLALADRCRLKVPVSLLFLGILSGLFSTCAFLIMRGRAPYYYIAVLSSMAFFYAFTFFATVAFSSARGSVRRYVFLALTSLSFALCFLSRINLGIGCAFLIIPCIFFFIIFNGEERTAKRVTCELASLASFALISIAFSFIYNYIRFDDIFEFGTKYQLTVSDISKNHIELSDLIPALRHYILTPFKKIDAFPFVELEWRAAEGVNKFIYTEWSFGIFALPLCLFLFYGLYIPFEKETKAWAKALVSSALLSVVFISLINFSLGGIMFRYTTDVLAISVPLALVLFFRLYEKISDAISGDGRALAIARKAFFVICEVFLILNLLLGILITVSYNQNLDPVDMKIYNTLYDLLIFWR